MGSTLLSSSLVRFPIQHITEGLHIKLGCVWWEQPLCVVWDCLYTTYIAVQVHTVCRKEEKKGLYRCIFLLELLVGKSFYCCICHREME